MLKKISDLTVQLSGTPLTLHNSENAAFLRGQAPLKLIGLWQGWKIVNNIVMVLGVSLLAGSTSFFMGETLIWYSPLTREATGIIDSIEGSAVYHYEVDGVRYDAAVDNTYRYWRKDTKPKIRYNVFQPSIMRLEQDIEEPNYADLFGGFIFGLLFLGSGWYWKRVHVRQVKLQKNCTHIVEAIVTDLIRNYKPPTITFFYRFISPTTGKEIGGSFWVGKLHPKAYCFKKGTTVAVLYAADDLHIAL